MFGHGLEIGPRHDLQQIAVERLRRREAIRRDCGRAVGVRVIQVHFGAQDLGELVKGAASGQTAALVGR